jgi:hypothetical protein
MPIFGLYFKQFDTLIDTTPMQHRMSYWPLYLSNKYIVLTLFMDSNGNSEMAQLVYVMQESILN